MLGVIWLGNRTALINTMAYLENREKQINLLYLYPKAFLSLKTITEESVNIEYQQVMECSSPNILLRKDDIDFKNIIGSFLVSTLMKNIWSTENCSWFIK
jgi:hypothetical protein